MTEKEKIKAKIKALKAKKKELSLIASSKDQIQGAYKVFLNSIK